MKKSILVLLSSLLTLFFMQGCSQKKPNHHPKNPNYAIEKPKIKYKPTQKSLNKMVKKLQGSPYVWAEEGPNNFDCSGFTYYLYGSMGIEIPRVARHQSKTGQRIDVKDLRYGDLIFFATDNRSSKKITHVGLYLGDGWFTHASTIKHEVVYSNLFTSKYYKKRLRVCRRYLPETTDTLASRKPWKAKGVTLPPTKPTKIPTIQATKEQKAIVIKAALKEIEQSSSKGNFYVQVGSFIGSPNNALLYKITRHGFKHKIIQFQKNGTHISKLLIGPYLSKREASNILKKVRKQIQKDAFIAEIR